MLQTATSGLQAASGEVIDNNDQFAVFNDPRAVSFYFFHLCDMKV